MKKRILSWALVLCMVLALLPGAAFAADVVASGECGAEGDNLTWTLDSEGVLTISGEGEMANYWDTPTPWGSQRDTIVAVVMETGVTSIGNSAFLWCSNLTSVTIPDSVTRIGEHAFDSCDSLTSITIPGSVTSIGISAFEGCSSLTSVTIPGSVTSIGGNAFFGCSSLTSVTIQDGVTSIGGGAFQHCSSLENLTLPDSIESVGTNILWGTAYDQNEANWVNHALYIGDYLIAVRNGVEQIEIGANVRCVADGAFGGAWYYPNLTSISVSQSNPYFTAHDGVLYNKNMTRLIACPSKKEGTLVVPSGITSIGNYAFARSANLTKIVLPEGLTSIGESAFYSCSSLTNVTIPDSVTSIGDSAFQDCSSLTNVTIPNGVMSIGDWAFRYCSSLTSVTIPSSVTRIGEYAFDSCDSLTDVYYSNTEEQWNAIAIADYNEPLTSATIHFMETPVHEHSYTAVVTAPTCTDKGYTTHTCACSDSYVDSYVDALGHTWNDGVVTTAPTATTDGVKTSTCTVCGETKTEVLPATGVEPVDPTTVFTDVTHNWAYNGIAYCVNNGLMDGVGDGHFDPDGATTRAMVVTILWRQAGCPEPTKASPFTDLKQDWYKKAVAWAAETGVVNGTTPTTFAPEKPISRQDTATILYRYVKDVLGQDVSKTADLSAFPDGGKVAGYAQTAMAWANAAGLIRGVGVDGVDYLDPQGNATRAQAATILMRFCENAAS